MSFGQDKTLGFSNPATQVVNRIIIEGPGQGGWVYNGTPAFGNLIETFGIETADTDSKGNAYLAGDTTYSDDAGTFIASQNNGGAFLYYVSPAGAGGPYTPVAALGFEFTGTTGHVNIQSTDGISASFNGTDFVIPQVLSAVIQTLPDDTNSGSSWVSGERAFMNNNWVAPINNNFAAIVAALQSMGVVI